MKEETGDINIDTLTYFELLDYLRENNLKLAPSTIKILKTLGYIPSNREYNLNKIFPMRKVSKYWIKEKGIPVAFLPCLFYDPRIADFCLKYITLKNIPIYINFINQNISAMSTDKILQILLYAQELDTNFKIYSTEDESQKDVVISTYLEYCSDPRIPVFTSKVNVLKVLAEQPTLKDMTTVYEALVHPLIRNNTECVNNAKSKRDIRANRRYLKSKTEILEKAIVANDTELATRINMAGEFFQEPLETIIYFEDYELLREILDGSDLLDILPVLAILNKCQNVDDYSYIRDICFSLIYYLKHKEMNGKRAYLKNVRRSIVRHMIAFKDEFIAYLLNELMLIVEGETKKISKSRLLIKK